MGKLLYLKNSRIEIINKPGAEVRDIIYFLAAEPVEIEVRPEVCIVMVYPYDWNQMMTPWVSGQGRLSDTGHGDEYARDFFYEVVAPVERSLVATDVKRGIAGYSLGGLMALYMATVLSGFDRVGSVSGSLWYDGAKEYFENNSFKTDIVKAYFSLGSKEAQSRDELRGCVGVNTEWLYNNTQKQLEAVYDINSGGHFSHIAERINKCIDYFMA